MFDVWWAYEEFASEVRRNRFVPTRSMRDFLEALRESSAARVHRLAWGTTLWRAQRGCTTTREAPRDNFIVVHNSPHPVERMVPVAEHIKEGGRANPAGVAYLYLSDGMQTAVAEVRPWVGASVTVANFSVARDLRLLDLTLYPKPEPGQIGIPVTVDPPSPEHTAQIVWSRLNSAFSQPTAPEDEQLHYTPTQYLAEFFREQGYDGLLYGSALANGKNIMLYRLDDAVSSPMLEVP